MNMVRMTCDWEYADVKVLLLHSDSMLPTYAHEGDSGADLYAAHALTLYPEGRGKVQLGVAIGLPPGFEAQIRPRSSLSAKGIVCAWGTIDQQYTGELAAVLYNLTGHVYQVEKHQRIAQLVIAPVTRARLQVVDTLDTTTRGDGGWGSTGT